MARDATLLHRRPDEYNIPTLRPTTPCGLPLLIAHYDSCSAGLPKSSTTECRWLELIGLSTYPCNALVPKLRGTLLIPL
jgi:hypothetical protein